MLECPKCHKKSKDNARYCWNCNHAFAVKVTSGSSKGESETDPLHRTHIDPLTGKPWIWG